MAVYRVEKSQNYTCMSNHHLRNENLSLKAKGLFSLMLSLPDDWDYSLEGLIKICKGGKHAVSTALHELEEEGYVICKRVRNKKGQLTASSYTIFEEPQMDHVAPASEESNEVPAGRKPAPSITAPIVLKPIASVQEAPKSEKPKSDFPALDNRTQLSTDKPSTKRLNTNSANLSISSSYSEDWDEDDDEMREEIVEEDSQQTVQYKLMKNIQYQSLIQDHNTDKRRLDSLLGMMADFLCAGNSDIYFAGARRSMQQIRERFSQLNIFHVEYVLDCFKRTTKQIFNIRKYMLTSLYNAPTTMDAYYDNRVNHDLYGGKKCL